jgi:hypothetical protein
MAKLDTAINGNKPAAPNEITEEDGRINYYFGLTKREYMATHIAAGMYAGGGNIYGDDTVECARKQADNLLAELDK